MRSKNLVQSWLEVELVQKGRTLTAALHDLNKALDSAHTHSRIREWEENRNGRGGRLPRKIRVYMQRIVLRAVLENSDIDTKKLTKRHINKLVEQLS